jgi:hypothetical protein
MKSFLKGSVQIWRRANSSRGFTFLVAALLVTLIVSFFACRRHQTFKRLRDVREFEQLLTAVGSAKLTRQEIISHFGPPDGIRDNGATQILVYSASDGLESFLLYPTQVKIVCSKSDGLVTTFQLRSD